MEGAAAVMAPFRLLRGKVAGGKKMQPSPKDSDWIIHLCDGQN